MTGRDAAKTTLGVKKESKKDTVRHANTAKPFSAWGARQVCEMVRSIGSSFEGAAVAMEENGIDGSFFLAMLENNDEDLTTAIADGGLGFTRLQLKRVKAQIEQHK